jgi:hypothetical protein
MKRSSTLVALSALSLSAQDVTPKLNGLVQLWYTQALDSRLRNNALAATQGNTYYDLSSNYTENGFVLRRAQLQASGAVPGVEGLSYVAMADFALSTTGPNATNANAAYNPTSLQDLYLDYRFLGVLEARVGQFKALQTYEGLQSPAHILFAERSQLGRRFADRRDRGLALGWAFGGTALSGKATLGVFNGTNDLAAGKANDNNAEKDLVGRLELTSGSAHHFGLYVLSGATDQKDTAQSPLVAKTFNGTGAPSADRVRSDKDRTTNLGGFYVFDNHRWHWDGEIITGRWGRRFPSVGAQAGASQREALNQSFLSYYATAAFTSGAHTFAVRYDFLNANQGRDWYTPYNPYTEIAPGVRRLVDGAPVDYTPRFTETTVGYALALNPHQAKAASLKLNLIHRSKTFLAPHPGERGAQGGDSLVAAIQAVF